MTERSIEEILAAKKEKLERKEKKEEMLRDKYKEQYLSPKQRWQKYEAQRQQRQKDIDEHQHRQKQKDIEDLKLMVCSLQAGERKKKKKKNSSSSSSSSSSDSDSKKKKKKLKRKLQKLEEENQKQIEENKKVLDELHRLRTQVTLLSQPQLASYRAVPMNTMPWQNYYTFSAPQNFLPSTFSGESVAQFVGDLHRNALPSPVATSSSHVVESVPFPVFQQGFSTFEVFPPRPVAQSMGPPANFNFLPTLESTSGPHLDGFPPHPTQESLEASEPIPRQHHAGNTENRTPPPPLASLRTRQHAKKMSREPATAQHGGNQRPEEIPPRRVNRHPHRRWEYPDRHHGQSRMGNPTAPGA